MFETLPRIEQPRPDITYGLWKQDISPNLRTILDTYHCELAKGLYLPFFIVEVKTQDALLGEAENQCIRGGASLVNTIHQWNRVAAGKKDVKDMTAKEKKDERNEFANAAEKALQVRTFVCLYHRDCPVSACLANVHDRIMAPYEVAQITTRLPFRLPFLHQTQPCMYTGGRSGRTGWRTGTHTRWIHTHCVWIWNPMNGSTCIYRTSWTGVARHVGWRSRSKPRLLESASGLRLRRMTLNLYPTSGTDRHERSY